MEFADSIFFGGLFMAYDNVGKGKSKKINDGDSMFNDEPDMVLHEIRSPVQGTLVKWYVGDLDIYYFEEGMNLADVGTKDSTGKMVVTTIKAESSGFLIAKVVDEGDSVNKDEVIGSYYKTSDMLAHKHRPRYDIYSPMDGIIDKWHVKHSQAFGIGQHLADVVGRDDEGREMRQAIVSTEVGVIDKIIVGNGQSVTARQPVANYVLPRPHPDRRDMFAPASGILHWDYHPGQIFDADHTLGYIVFHNDEGHPISTPVFVHRGGVLTRLYVADGAPVTKGVKIAEYHPMVVPFDSKQAFAMAAAGGVTRRHHHHHHHHHRPYRYIYPHTIGVLGRWLVREGQFFQRGQHLVDIVTSSPYAHNIRTPVIATSAGYMDRIFVGSYQPIRNINYPIAIYYKSRHPRPHPYPPYPPYHPPYSGAQGGAQGGCCGGSPAQDGGSWTPPHHPLGYPWHAQDGSAQGSTPWWPWPPIRGADPLGCGWWFDPCDTLNNSPFPPAQGGGSPVQGGGSWTPPQKTGYGCWWFEPCSRFPFPFQVPQKTGYGCWWFEPCSRFPFPVQAPQNTGYGHSPVDANSWDDDPTDDPLRSM